MAGDELLTVPDVAARFKVTQETVRRWLRSKKLRGLKISDAAGYRVRASEVERFISGAEADQEGQALAPEPRGAQGGEMTGTERGREG